MKMFPKYTSEEDGHGDNSYRYRSGPFKSDLIAWGSIKMEHHDGPLFNIRIGSLILGWYP